MEVKDIKLNVPFDFTIEQNDWEYAPDAICMLLVDDKSWNKVAARLEAEFKDCSIDAMTEYEVNDLFDEVWAAYEKAVLEECKVFYYEDMTDDEFDIFKSLSKEKRDEYLEIVYKRIKNLR